jgi:hypothetical protein
MSAVDEVVEGVIPGSLDAIEVLEVVGVAGSITRCRGRDRTSGAPVAVELCPADAPAAGRLVRAAGALERVRHPNLVALVAAGRAAGHAYLATAPLDGAPLAEVRRPLPWPRVVAIALGVSRALAALHQRGVVHGGVEPGRILCGDHGAIVLGDLGDAVALELPELHPVTARHRYQAPEVRRGERPTPRSDLWSLGMVLYERLALPRAIALDGSLGLLAELRPGLPLSLADLIQRCVAASPAARPASAAPVRDALDRMSIHVPVTSPARGAPLVGADVTRRVTASFARVAGRAAAFAERVHTLALERAPSLVGHGEALGGRRQVFAALHLVVAQLGSTDRLDAYLVDVALRHDGAGLSAAEVGALTRSLLDALAEHDAAHWCADLDHAWRATLTAVAARLASATAA